MPIETKTLKVVGQQTMNCGGCENTVKFALEKRAGIQAVQASYQTQLINLTVDTETVAMDQIQQELDWIGYQVIEVEENRHANP